MLAEYVHDLVPDDLFLTIRGIAHLRRLAIKLEGCNPAGSIKVKAAAHLVAHAEHLGVDFRTTTLIESSSGNLGVALAMICAAKGYRFTCVVDPNTNDGALKLMRACGADVVVVRERDANGGYLMTRLDYVRHRQSTSRTYWLDQYTNAANPGAHRERTAPAVLRQFPDLDYLFVGVGTGGTLRGCLQHLAEHRPEAKVVAVDSQGSVSFGGPAARRRIPGLGSSRRPPHLDGLRPHDVVHVAEQDTLRECRALALTHGLVAGGSTGTVLAAVRAYATHIPADARVVAIAPDAGDRYLDTVYDDAWAQHLLASAAPLDAPDAPHAPAPSSTRSLRDHAVLA